MRSVSSVYQHSTLINIITNHINLTNQQPSHSIKQQQRYTKSQQRQQQKYQSQSIMHLPHPQPHLPLSQQDHHTHNNTLNQNRYQIQERINADNNQPKNILCFWVVFALALIVVLVLAFVAVPKEIVIKNNWTQLGDTLDSGCRNPCGFDNNVLICLILRNTNPFHQFALISLQLTPSSPSPSSTQIHPLNQSLTLTLSSLKLIRQQNIGKFVQKQQLANRTLQISDNQQKSFYFYGEKIQHFIGYYRQVQNQGNYLLVIKFSDTEQIIGKNMVPVLKAILVNPQFTICVLIVRGVCFVCSLLVCVLYFRMYFSIESAKRSKQQKLVGILGISIVLFNDPFYILSILFPNFFTTILSSILLSQLLAYIYFFWYSQIAIIHASTRSSSSKCTSRLSMFLILYFLLYFGIVTLYYYQISQTVDDDYFIYHLQEIQKYDYGAVIRYWVTINTIICLILKLVLLFKKQSILWRHFNLLLFNLYFICLLLIFGSALGSLYTENSRLIFVTIVSINIYAIYMMYMYMPYNKRQDKLGMVRVPQSGQEVYGGNWVEVSLEDMEIVNKFKIAAKKKKKIGKDQSNEEGSWSQDLRFK